MKKPLSVYIHFPFCERRCGYCDFFTGCDLGKIDAYLTRLCAEIRAFDFSHYTIKTIYFGGGTPSLLTPTQLQKVLNCLPGGATEITLEANPNSLTAAKCRAYRAAGVNRLSIGVQSFDDQTLCVLGRLHDVKQAVSAIKTAHQYFTNLSIDLIKDIPGQRFVSPPADVIALVQHVSIYSLTKDDRPVMETDERVHLPANFQRYEVSNYARPGYECQHNLVYWTGGEYLGFGAGAHSLLNNVRFANSNDLLNYQRLPAEPRTPEMIRHEEIMLGLRLRTGVNRWLLSNKEAVLTELQQKGYLRMQGEQVIATQKGLRVLNQLWLWLV